MKTINFCRIAILVCLANIPMIGSAAEIVVDYYEPLQRLIFNLDSSQARNQKPSDLLYDSIRFDAFGRSFDIRLEENRSIIDIAERQQMIEQIGLYRGEIVGETNTWVRLTFQDAVPRGMLWDGQEMYAIDEVNGATSIYRLADLRVTDGDLTCEVASNAGNAAELLKVVLREGAASAPQLEAQGAISEMDIGVVGDFEFFSDKGVTAEAEILTRMNNVDGIFSTQLGVQLNVNEIEVFSSANDPFSDETVPGDLLDEVKDYRGSTPAQRDNGLSHLFTGRNLDGSTVGIAFGGSFGGVLCSQFFGAGLTQATHSATFDSLIVAHELGHNFGSPHDGTTGSVCESTPRDFLMAPSLNGSDILSACSITQMQDDVAGAVCITALPSADVSVVAAASTETLLLGDRGSLLFDVNSNGTEAVTNVVVSLPIPANVTLTSVSSTAGNCTSGAGDVSCTLGSIAAGSGVSINLDIDTPSVGFADIVASVTADTDANAANNQASTSLTIDPAVDLVLGVAATAQVDENQSTVVLTNVENRSSLQATNIILTVMPSSGITIDSATWISGTCDIANTIVTCQAANLAPQSNDELSMQITGVTEGAESYAMSVAASEVDRDSSNNTASGQINVGTMVVANAGGGSAQSGGGGSMNLALLLLLALFWLTPIVCSVPRNSIRCQLRR